MYKTADVKRSTELAEQAKAIARSGYHGKAAELYMKAATTLETHAVSQSGGEYRRSIKLSKRAIKELRRHARQNKLIDYRDMASAYKSVFFGIKEIADGQNKVNFSQITDIRQSRAYRLAEKVAREFGDVEHSHYVKAMRK